LESSKLAPIALEKQSMSRFAIVIAAALSSPADCTADEIADGIYSVQVAGAGRAVTLSDGAAVILGPRRQGSWAEATMRSLANDNTRFLVELKSLDKLVEQAPPATVVLMMDGVGMPFHSRSEHADGRVNLAFTVFGDDAARRVAARLKVEPKRRQHPGHCIEVRWLPDKAAFSPTDSISLKLELRNVGDKPIAFRNGGQQRGARNNQFRFLAYRTHGHGKAVPDTGDPTHFGGLSSILTLKPGETFRETVQLEKWFAFKEADTYRVTGLYELELHDGASGTTIWDDFAIGDCLIRIANSGQ
jgi:hypothetical protein